MILTSLFLLLLCGLVLKPVNDFSDSFEVQVLAHSKSAYGVMVVSFYLKYPRFIHSEMMTHKDFSRSAASSRAIPVMKMLKQVWNQPAIPKHWGANMPGMQAKEELSGWRKRVAINLWVLAGRTACVFAWFLTKLGLHKQVANRILEPWQLMHVTLTTSKVANFFNLRIHPDAQPEICYLASMMKERYLHSTPIFLDSGEYHLPWITGKDVNTAQNIAFELCIPAKEVLKKASTARCARSSYGTFGGGISIMKDLELYDKLIIMKPVHASPAEHQCTPDVQVTDLVAHGGTRPIVLCKNWAQPELHGNLTGWIQHRKQIPDHYLED
jgi:hypothetical protein